jgi:hypothetical protein
LEHGTRISKEEHVNGAWNKQSEEDHANGTRNKNKYRRPRHWSLEQEKVKKITPLEQGTRISKEDQEDHAIGACNKKEYRRPCHWCRKQKNK